MTSQLFLVLEQIVNILKYVEVLVPVTEEKELETFLFLFSLVIWESMTSQLFLLLQQIVNTYLQMFCVKLMDEYSVDDWRLMYCVRNQ